MKFGLRYASLGRYSNGPAAVELAQAAEAAGFDSIWTVEHVVVPHGYQSRYPYSPTGRMGSGLEDYPIPDPLIWLAYIASATRTIKLGTAILILPQRNPGGHRQGASPRSITWRVADACCWGSAWAGSPRSSPRSGCPSRTAGRAPTSTWPRCARSGARSAPAYKGRFVSFDQVFCRPLPPERRIPIIVGGDTAAAARRAGRLGDGYFPARHVASRAVRRDAPRRRGRRARSQRPSRSPSPRRPSPPEIEALARQGVTRVAVPVSCRRGIAGPGQDARRRPPLRQGR